MVSMWYVCSYTFAAVAAALEKWDELIGIMFLNRTARSELVTKCKLSMALKIEKKEDYSLL